MRRAASSLVVACVVIASLLVANDAVARPGSGASFTAGAARQASGTPRSRTASTPRSRSWWSRVEVPNDTWTVAPSYSMPRDDASKRTRFDPEYPASWGTQATGPRGSMLAYFFWIVIGLAVLVAGIVIAKRSARRRLKAWSVRGVEHAAPESDSAASESER